MMDSPEQHNQLANMLAKRFIARPDVKAVQHSSGIYTPVHEKFSRVDLLAHLTGESTYGHYLLNTNDTCKLFAFDIDLASNGSYEPFQEVVQEIQVEDLREAWKDRKHPGRPWWKYQFKSIANLLMAAARTELGLHVACAYSGAKGIHVYGFTGQLPAADVREAANLTLEIAGGFEPLKGDHFFTHEDYSNFTIEVFPKQTSLGGKDLGNLMRLPLGKNKKNPKDPTFFVDFADSPLGDMRPIDPLHALTDGYNPWSSVRGK